ncbi:MAG TPA: hypothetical protein PK052_01620 [Anaerohalosphaeraceae bacterium]|nr:hypothetical protein [Anaerohalosphaeraceae bacterium]HOL30655.1 hypothetical protein [Anaerohalosphaeraceae bacterium]HOM75921.1 hypothetical protein [Anaerohalosphaeraceae bacterium]HPC63387.1 hypothetical protein [Anaerohalosphaeraceae bacterium]HPO70343.1 hypothetical protein [Anaerohalosphaeraceae bacterium]
MMAEEGKKTENAAVNPDVAAFIRSLDEPHRMLIILKAQLYGGRWEPMLDDLQNRLKGKPYIFKLSNRIKEDIERINRLQAFEAQQGIDLADYVKLESL